MTGSISYIAPRLFDPVKRSDWPFGDLVPGAYDLIMCDPPWRFETYSELGRGKSAEQYYETMTLADIQALPLSDLARSDCVLWLWATAPMLDAALATLEIWGWRYITSAVWVKNRWGTGYVVRNRHEHVLIGKIGEPEVDGRSISSVIEAPVREHSQKPEAAYRMAETMMPGARRCEVFSCTDRAGWDTCGDQSGILNNGGKRSRIRDMRSTEQEVLL